jgi:hypothetical protein
VGPIANTDGSYIVDEAIYPVGSSGNASERCLLRISSGALTIYEKLFVVSVGHFSVSYRPPDILPHLSQLSLSSSNRQALCISQSCLLRAELDKHNATVQRNWGTERQFHRCNEKFSDIEFHFLGV